MKVSTYRYAGRVVTQLLGLVWKSQTSGLSRRRRRVHIRQYITQTSVKVC